MLNRKLFLLTGCLCLLGILARAQAPVAQFTANPTSGCAPLTVKFTDQSGNKPTSWEWDFGNGQVSSQESPTIGFGPGTYTITLIVKNSSGTDAIRQLNYITVYASPTVSFGLNHLACAPTDIQFQQFSQPGQGVITNYVWNFGDGSTGSGATPTHLYTQPGYYTVGLTVTNSGGCSDSVKEARILRLVPGVQTNFTWNATGGSCTAPYTLDFLNQTAGPGTMTYNWSLGTGAAPATSAATNPSGVSYPTAGNYPVKLVAQSSLGCADSLTQTVPLSSNPPVITAPAAGCVNSAVNFSNGTNPAPLYSSWNFGDGSPGSNQSSTSHTYSTAGPYTVTLTNTYASCTATTTTTINIGASLVPTFSATPATACQAPLAVQFADNDIPADSLWTWNFGDNSPPVSNSPNPLHTYASPGNYTVTLTTSNSSGCTGTATQTSLVNITPPVINAAVQGACVSQAYTPTYTVTSFDPVASYSWSAPGANPSTATVANPSFTYPATGSYTLNLTITTNSGCTATQNLSVQVGTPTPASFTYSPASPICGVAPVTFNSPSTPADLWTWNFGDGPKIDSGQTVTHQFLAFGTENVTLSVTHDGCTTSFSNPVVVNPPIPNFGYVVNCYTNNPVLNNGLLVSFSDSSLIDTAAAFAPISYKWVFGGGLPNSGSLTTAPYTPPPHPYPGPGTYSVTLTVAEPGTCISFATRAFTLETVNPSFTVSQNPVCNLQNFTLTSTSITTPPGSAVNNGYVWTIGSSDSGYAGPTLITHLRGVGNYPFTLSVVDQNGCRYTTPPTIVTVTAPTAKFTAPPGGCKNSAISFTDNSTPSAAGTAFTSYIWNFGDSTTQSFAGPPFTHHYADTGSYTVIEEVIDNGGCGASDTIVAAVQITSPHALFLEPDSFYCPNTPLTFIDLSEGYGLTESWNFGDGSGPSPTSTHTYPATIGVTYPVTLTITDKYSCATDTTEKIKIESPVAAFTIADTTGICVPLQTIFTAAGQYYDSLYWEFGDGSTSTLANTPHFYNSLDTFTATLVVQGPGGCLDSTSRQVYLTNPNTTVFQFTPKTACDSVVAQFTILPPDYTSFILQFADGTADSSGNEAPVHTYRNINTYVPFLYLTDATGCIVTVGDGTLTVLGAVPFFTAAPVAFCDTGTVTFSDYSISNNGVQSKTFSFGDGGTQSESPPLTSPFNTSYYYSTPGNFLATLTVVTLANCTASYTDTIRVYQTPRSSISDSGYLCAGLVQFLGKLAVPDVDTVFWQWDFGNGQTSNVQNPLVKAGAGTYTVTLKAFVSLGCSDTTSTTVTINPDPTIKGPKEISTPVGVPVTIPFTYSPDVMTWSWLPVTNLSCTDCPNPSATLIFAQTYTVLVVDSNNCTDTASILINTICKEENYFFPNTFSPNGDGVNDYFYPRGTALFNIQSLTIFNRWGQIVFQRKNFPANSETMGWDGTFNGKPAPMDAYVYIAEVICNNAQVVAIHGNVTLVR